MYAKACISCILGLFFTAVLGAVVFIDGSSAGYNMVELLQFVPLDDFGASHDLRWLTGLGFFLYVIPVFATCFILILWGTIASAKHARSVAKLAERALADLDRP